MLFNGETDAVRSAWL